MTEAEIQEPRPRKASRKLRCTAENTRLRQELERIAGRRAGHAPDPLAAGQ